jgi:hypothetical protein
LKAGWKFVREKEGSPERKDEMRKKESELQKKDWEEVNISVLMDLFKRKCF